MGWWHRLSAKLLANFKPLRDYLTVSSAGDFPISVPQNPFANVEDDPFSVQITLITTGGVHTPDQKPFDMSDSRGDTSFRVIPQNQSTFKITHDYYDHSDADRDINCLFPLPLARHLSKTNCIGSLSNHHFSFMGHVEDPLLLELKEEQFPKLWDEWREKSDLVLLSPG